MGKNVREFVDKDHKVADAYYDLCDKYDETNVKSVKTEIKKLIKKDVSARTIVPKSA